MFLLLFIALLVALILVHEFGHFVVAKLFGIRVDEFGIFFPPRITALRLGETEYSLNWLPFGGFVKIFGENEQDLATEHSGGAGAAMDPRRMFVRRSRPVQAAVLVAGVLFNILFAWLALSLGYMVGMQTSAGQQSFGTVEHVQATIVDVLPGSPASKAGLLPEDTITAAETGTAQLGEPITADAIQTFIRAHENESVVLTVSRETATGTESAVFLAKPEPGLAQGHKAIGVSLDDIGMLRLPLPLALLQGALVTEQMTVSIAQGLGGFFVGIVHGGTNLSSVTGPIGIAGVGAAAVKQGFVATIILLSLISINLAIINLLPIPGLDGGRLLFVLIEAIIRRPISEKLSLRLTIAGFAFLLILMALVSFHDIIRLVHPAV